MAQNSTIAVAPPAPIQTPLTLSLQGVLTSPGWLAWFNSVQQAAKQAYDTANFFLVATTTFGAAGNGTSDDTAALQQAINQAVANGGGIVILPAGVYSIGTVTFPAGVVPITLLGTGEGTILKRRAVLSDGVGMLDILGSNVTLDSLLIDGDVTAPAGLFYNQDFAGVGTNDPMAASLTKNTSVWLHGGTGNFTCHRVKWQHTGGYAALIDARNAGISDVRFVECLLENNRPHLFGIPGGQAIYGSWTGGIHVQGDGRAAHPGCILRHFIVERCNFLRGTGNQCWSHLYGLDELHEDFRLNSNYFCDLGLDGILVGGVTGGAVSGNVFRRIGYTTLDDNSQSTPRWLPNLCATGLDSSGVVRGVPYEGNSFLSVNGGCLDLDGHGYSVISGNFCRIPEPDDPEYKEDQIAITGPTNSGPAGYGVNMSNSANTKWGSASVMIASNCFINLPSGACRLFAARRCFVTANDIVAPDNSPYPPILLGPIGPGPNQRCFDNKISGNRISYSPPAAAPAIREDESFAAFLSTETNGVFSNTPIAGNGNAVEFQKSPNSGSTVYNSQVWFP